MLVLIWVMLAVFAFGFFVAVDEMGYCGLRPTPFVVATVSAVGLVATIGVLSFVSSEIAARDRYDEQRIYLYERMKDCERSRSAKTVRYVARGEGEWIVTSTFVVTDSDPGTVILPDHVTQRGSETSRVWIRQ